MARYRITLTPVPDDCTDADTADERALRDFGTRPWIDRQDKDDRQVRNAIAAALPKPRIHPQPGDVLRRKRWGTFSLATRPHGSDGEVWIAGYGLLTSGLDPDEWEIVTAAELAELFEKKRNANL